MNLDRRTFQIPEDHQRSSQIFLVHMKSLSSMLWVTFISGTNPPINQKIPLVVSSCHIQRAPEAPAFQHSGRLSGTLTESTLSDEAKGTGGMMVRFSSNTASHSCRICIFLWNFEPTRPDCGSNLVTECASIQLPRNTRQLVHHTLERQIRKQDLVWMANEWECFATDRPRCQRVTKVQRKVPRFRGSPRSTSPKRSSSRVGKCEDKSSYCPRRQSIRQFCHARRH